MVGRTRPQRPAVATPPHCLPCLGLRNHATANPGQNRYSLLRPFYQRFPDIQSLSASSTDDVLAFWSGLGYYARARNLLKTAIICKRDHAADLPQSPEELVALPGIGESTANAIYSQAYNQPAVILDGNVKRVLSRYLAVEGWPGKARFINNSGPQRRSCYRNNGEQITPRPLWISAQPCVPGQNRFAPDARSGTVARHSNAAPLICFQLDARN